MGLAGGVLELEFDRAGALHFEAVVEGLTGCQCLGTEALAGVVHFEGVQGGALVGDGGLDKGGMAASCQEYKNAKSAGESKNPRSARRDLGRPV